MAHCVKLLNWSVTSEKSSFPNLPVALGIRAAAAAAHCAAYILEEAPVRQMTQPLLDAAYFYYFFKLFPISQKVDMKRSLKPTQRG